MKWVIFWAGAAVALPMIGLAQDGTRSFDGRYLCVDNALPVGDDAPHGVLEMLKYINKTISRSPQLEISGRAAVFGHDPELPDFAVVAAVNDVVIMERGYLLDAGPGCDAFADLTGPQVYPECHTWTVKPLTAEDVSSKQIRLVWERLTFRRKSLEREFIYSGDKKPTVIDYSCEDFDTIARYAKQ